MKRGGEEMPLGTLERLLEKLELAGELLRRLRCIRWEQDCRFEGRNCLEYKLTCHDTEPAGRILRRLGLRK